MIEGIKEIGELKLKKEGRDTSNLLSILVQDPNQNGRYPKVLVAVFKKKVFIKVMHGKMLLFV